MGKPPKSPEANVSYGKSKKIIMHMRRRSASRRPADAARSKRPADPVRFRAGCGHPVARARICQARIEVPQRRKFGVSPV